MKKQELIAKAKSYVTGAADYNGNGYDVFCECYGTEEWAEFLNRHDDTVIDTWGELKEMVDTIAAIHADRQADAINSAF